MANDTTSKRPVTTAGRRRIRDSQRDEVRSAMRLLATYGPIIVAAFSDVIDNRRPPAHCVVCDGGGPPCPDHQADRQQTERYRLAAGAVQRHLQEFPAQPGRRCGWHTTGPCDGTN